ncbi:MAG: hypothetical protein PHS82_14480 [Lachnospiraceae bacterium]|nr:hypothetical protein [Lachnospiraceae bacterium]
MQKKRWIIVLFVMLLLVVGSGIFFWRVTKSAPGNTDGIVVKDHVTVITDETPKDKQPISITDNELIFNDNPGYSPNDIIVAGITDSAPAGFIRKVISIANENNQYIVKTEYGVLTDVFEKASIVKRFALTERGAEEIPLNATVQVGKSNQMHNISYSNTKVQNDVNTMRLSSGNDNTEYQFSKEFNYEITDEISVTGEVGFNAWVEIEIDISDGDIIFGIAAHNESGGNAFVGCGFDSEINAFEEKLFKKSLPNIQFFIGVVPVVITNEIASTIEGSAHVQGSLGTSFEIKSENTSGFEYNSKTDKIEEITDRKYYADGLRWETKTEFSADSSMGIFLHLITKLYDSTGADIAIGIEGETAGQVSVSLDKSLDGLNYVGNIDSSIHPKLKGRIVVTVPIIDEKLAEKELFEIKLTPLWERHWDSGSDWKEKLQELKKDNNGNHTTDEIALNHTYTTKFGETNLITYPRLLFAYPDNWSVSLEEVTPYTERVVLTNERGANIEYSQGKDPGSGQGYTYTAFAYRADVSKVADSNFVPGWIQGTDYSQLGKFMVAKVDVNGELDRQLDDEYTDIDGGSFYVVAPESKIGTIEYIPETVNPYSEFDFGYGSFVAYAPDQQFTEQEVQEITQILASFRTE